ncbi:hypothetical protein Q5762_34375 [Streptomyces sp. P9(2023)]|uniref:hypothetical protein n=1 Tax=Streptomyces sp. P9(2023) TaxID=3064394 RepID=UPI0028F4259A|nr:hypothetical protein [Streptomyces sp. P9(2023)]MDT9693325.1 hypothetical protein [Streptomyces sp. P9(2023)]
MTDASNEPDEDALEPHTAGPDQDLYLHILSLYTSVAEGSSIGVILNVNGAVVAGKMISPKEWHALWVEQVTQAHSEIGETLSSAMATLREGLSEEPHLQTFAHLRDATVMTGETRISLSLWRGPLSHIAGWSHGIPEGYEAEQANP